MLLKRGGDRITDMITTNMRKKYLNISSSFDSNVIHVFLLYQIFLILLLFLKLCFPVLLVKEASNYFFYYPKRKKYFLSELAE